MKIDPQAALAVSRFYEIIQSLYKSITTQLRSAGIGLEILEWLSGEGNKVFRDTCARLITEYQREVKAVLIDLNEEPQKRRWATARIPNLPTEGKWDMLNPSTLDTSCRPVALGEAPISGEEFIARACAWAERNGQHVLNTRALDVYLKPENEKYLPTKGEEGESVDSIFFIGDGFTNMSDFYAIAYLLRQREGWGENHCSVKNLFNSSYRVATAVTIPIG